MEIRLNLNGRKRKVAAVCIGDAINAAPVYRGAPTYAYDIGGLILDRDGVLHLNDSDEAFTKVLSALESAEFYTPEPEPETVEPLPDTPDRLVVQMPLADFTPVALNNLEKLIASKATLIRKAIGAESLPVEKGAETLNFPWLKVNATPEEVTACTQLVAALCDMAKKQRRVTATERSATNEKYAFRCFLLRLGFIGESFAAARRVLLRNLSGDGSRKSGKVSREVENPAELTTDDGEVDGARVANGAADVETDVKTAPAPNPRFSFGKLVRTLKSMVFP